VIEHASELIPALVYCLLVLCGTIAGAVRWAVLDFRRATKEQTAEFSNRLEHQDNQLRAIRDLLADEVFKLREMIHAIDKRVLTIEGHCQLFHGRGAPLARADFDGDKPTHRPPE
jgi:hypothetical protein